MKSSKITYSRLRRVALLYAAAFYAFIGLVGNSPAAVIYSNLGPNNSFFATPGTYPVWNLNSGGFIHRAASFTVPGSQNVKFGSAELGFFLQNGSNLAKVELAANAAGNLPGNVIESIGFQLPAPSANPTIVTATSNTNPTLVAGSTYWIIASMQFPHSMATWGSNNQGALGGNATHELHEWTMVSTRARRCALSAHQFLRSGTKCLAPPAHRRWCIGRHAA